MGVFVDDKVSEYNHRIPYDFPGIRTHQTSHASYGYWLAIPSESDEIAQISIFGVPKNLGVMPSAAITTADIDRDNHKAIKSGEFTADVKLTATFKAEPKVKGTMNNFKTNAGGGNWSVELAKVDLINTWKRPLAASGVIWEWTLAAMWCTALMERTPPALKLISGSNRKNSADEVRWISLILGDG